MLNEKDMLSIGRLKTILSKKYDLHSVIVFGSKAHGTADDESDIDLMVFLNQDVNNSIEEKIFGIAFDVELECDVVFGIIVKNIDAWRRREQYYPLGQNITRDGIAA